MNLPCSEQLSAKCLFFWSVFLLWLQEPELFIDTTTMPTVMKTVKRISKQQENESRRLASQLTLFSLQLSYILNVFVVLFSVAAQIMERCYD